MKKDISFLPVEGVKLAVVRKLSEAAVVEWNVVLMNDNDFPLTTVMITSRGYSNDEGANGVKQQTSVLRHFHPEVAAKGHVIIEPIMPELFKLYNEYWVSYYVENQILDKKFVFVPDSIVEKNMSPIPALEAEGVIHE